MAQPPRIAQQTGRHALVDDIPFQMPVQGIKSSAILAAFPCDPVKARVLLQGNEIHPFVLWNKALLVVTVVDYRHTNIGKYIEFSIALACTHGARPGAAAAADVVARLCTAPDSGCMTCRSAPRSR